MYHLQSANGITYRLINCITINLLIHKLFLKILEFCTVIGNTPVNIIYVIPG